MLSFRNGVGTKKTATIRGDGFDPFEVVYQAPSSADLLNADIVAAREGAGEAAVWLSAKCLQSWSLSTPLPADQDGREALLESIDPAAVLLSIYLELKESGRESLKN